MIMNVAELTVAQLSAVTLKAEKDVLQRDLEATEAALRDEKIQRSQLSAQCKFAAPGLRLDLHTRHSLTFTLCVAFCLSG
jgi:hypothetical protein